MRRQAPYSPATEGTEPLGKVLFLLAHCDDEFFILPRIQREIEVGSEVHVVFTTDGAGYDADPRIRLSESVRVLSGIGVSDDRIHGIGAALGIKDGQSHHSVERLFNQIVEKFPPDDLSRLYVLAWEAGHADHDVTHLLGAALKARAKHIRLLEFSAYRASSLGGPFFTCMSLLPGDGKCLRDTVSLAQALKWFGQIFKYKTQRRALFGLACVFWYQVLARRQCVYRVVPNYDYVMPPHKGRLFYESRFKVPFKEFKTATDKFISVHLRPSREDMPVSSHA